MAWDIPKRWWRARWRASRRKPYVFTKCERVWNDKGEIGKSLKRDSIRREVEASLRRLKLDVIDLYQIHWPEPDEDVEEGWETMARVEGRGQGALDRRVQFQCGADGARAGDCPHYFAAAAVFNLLTRAVEESILPYAQGNGIGVIVYSPMKSGLLTGGDDAGADGGDAR